MEADAIAEYIDRSQSVIDSSPQMNEESTKEKLVRPLIELLGWDFYFEVEPEYPVQMGSTRKKADYALILEETPVGFIEVKGNDTTISDSDRNQLRSYMRQVGVDWGLLTNGQTFEIYQRRTNQSRPTEHLLGDFTLEEMENKLHLLRTLSKESIQTGESENIAENIQAIHRAVNQLREEKDKFAGEVSRVVINEIGDVASQTVENESKQFIDRLIASFAEQSQDIGEHQPRSHRRLTLGEDSKKKKWTPEKEANAIAGTVSRREIEGDDNATVAVFPTKKSGIQFLKENNAWGFVHIGRNPGFAAMYVTEGESEVRYIAQVDSIVEPSEASLARPLDSYKGDQASFDPNKKVILFEPGSLYELKDPIPYKSEYPRSRRYTTLGEFREADTTDDIL